MMYLHRSFAYAGDPATAPHELLAITFQLPVFTYPGVERAEGMQRVQTGTSTVRHELRFSDSAYEAVAADTGLRGDIATAPRFYDFTAAVMRQGEAGVRQLAFPIGLELAVGEFRMPYARPFKALYFVKGLNADGHQDHPARDEIFLVNAERYDEALPAFQQLTHHDSDVSLLAFLKLLAEENDLSPDGPPGPERVNNDRLQGIVHQMNQENVEDFKAFLQNHFFALFDFAIALDALVEIDIAGYLHITTADDRPLAKTDLYFYRLAADYGLADPQGSGVHRTLEYDWHENPDDPAANRIPFSVTGPKRLLRNFLQGPIAVYVRGFDGAELWRRVYAPDDPQLKEIPIELAEYRPGVLTPEPGRPGAGTKRLRGKLTGLTQACPFKDAVVLVQAKAEGDAAWRVVGDAVADSQGNFSMPYPYGTYVAAQALVSLTPNSPVDIPMVQGVPNETIAPDFLYLLVSDPVCDEPAADQQKDCDCDSPVKISRLPSQEDLINSDEYTQDIGGSCVNLSTPNRTLSEYNYTGVVRTSDPSVANYTLKRKTLTTLQGEEVAGFELEGGAQTILRKPVNLDNPIRWQDTPADFDYLSFYQAVTVATGHILHYKSVFKADGYSLGDLVYSLALAPGQKKQIVVFDSSHTLQGAESQSISQGERLTAGIVDEREIADQLGGSLAEAMQGRSSASTSGVSAGLGIGASLGVVSGALGVAGGTASSSSSASQSSSRNTSQFFAEKLRQAIMQNADSYRQLNASVVTTVQEGQHYNATTEVVANHNHCHSLTMMYFEVLRHFAVFQELTEVEECVFVPLWLTNFTMENIHKWSDVLAIALLPIPSNTYLQPFAWRRQHPLLKGFDANERIRTNYAHVDFPAARYCDDAITEVRGNFDIRMALPRPKTKFDRILSLPIIRTTVTTPAGVDVAGTIRDNIKSSAIAAATGGLSLLFGGGPSVKYETVSHDVLSPGKIFDLFMTLDENFESVSPARCIRVHSFEDQQVLVNGTNVQIDFFHDMGDDAKIWDAYAELLGITRLELLNKFANNVIADWDRIFYSDIAPALVSRLLSESTLSLKPFSSLDITALNRYASKEQLLRYNFVAQSNSTRAAIGHVDLQYQLGSVSPTNHATLKREITMIVESLNVNYATRHYNGRIYSGYVGDDLFDGVTRPTPMNFDEQRNPRKEDVFIVNRLTEHLNSNLEHYNKALWLRLDPDRRFMLLDGFSIQVYGDNGMPLVFRSLASVVKNELICVTGNSLVFSVAPGYRVSQSYIVETGRDGEPIQVSLFDHYRPLTPPAPFRISVPSRGVFLEAVQGACDACEKVKENSSQDWVKFTADEPSAIAPLTPPTPTITDWRAAFKDFAPPLINIQNAPTAPTPGAGLAGLADLLGKAGIFKDITGLDANQQNVIRTYLSNQENAKAFAEMAQKLSMQGHNTANSDKIMDTLKSARQDGAISQEDYGKLVKEHIQKQIDGGDQEKSAVDRKMAEKSSLSSAAVKAIDQGKNVKAQKTDPEGNAESVEVSAGGAEPVLAKFAGTVPKMKQENNMACWATVATMMVSWKEGKKLGVEEVLQKAGAQYVTKFQNHQGLASSEKEAFISALGMRGEAPASYSLQQYIDWVNTYGPLWITTDSSSANGLFSPHARVVTRITGTGGADGSGTSFVFIDPATGAEVVEPFSAFVAAYEQMVTDNPGALFVQIVHFADPIGIVGEGAGPAATPVPAWADAVDLFPGSVTVNIDRNNATMNTAFAPITVSSVNHLCAALGNVTGQPATAPFAGLHEEEMLYVGSLLKVGVMYAAFALRARVQAFADAAKANGVTTAPELFSLVKQAWAPKLKALFPTRSTTSFGNNQDVTTPQFDKIFTLTATGEVKFATASPAISNAQLDAVGDHGAPIGLFHESMRLMMRWSNNTAASKCVLALGYFYINGLLAKTGFFDAATSKGLWISGDYLGHDWVKTAAERTGNAAGVALTARWATAQGRQKSNFVGNALQVGRLMTAMAQDTLTDPTACADMRKLADQLSDGIGSYGGSALAAVGRAPSKLSSKIGFGDDSFSHDCVIVERTANGKALRYAATVLGSAPARNRKDLSDLFVMLDDAVVTSLP